MKTLLTLLEERVQLTRVELKNRDTARRRIVQLLAERDILLTDSVSLYVGFNLWFGVETRADLEALLTLAPAGQVWSKEYSESGITYRLTLPSVEGEEEISMDIHIYAAGEALPPTCKLVEEIVEVPAQPATTKVVRRVRCSEAVTAAANTISD